LSVAPLSVVPPIPLPHAPRPAVVTIGNFDGVHLGHQALLRRARALADAVAAAWSVDPSGVGVVALTFDPSPRDVMQPGHGVPAIQPLGDRVALLREHGADVVCVEPFTAELASWSAEAFAERIVAERLGGVGVVVGWDFRFGAGRRGDAGLMARVLGVPVEVVGAVDVGGAPVSSTRVRLAVAAGRLDEACALLGRPHRLSGTVVHGDHRGRTIGFPTANVQVETALRPPDGVYAVRAQRAEGGPWMSGVANLGRRPTFEPGVAALEVHLFDRELDLYGARLHVELVQFLRPERRFDGLDALVAQIRLDADAARAVLA
jgi:riboflavin kinase/FMN adenylyltransferase